MHGMQWEIQGRGPGGPDPLIFRPKWGPKGGKKIFGRPAPNPPPPPLSQGVDYGPPNLKFWIRHWNVARIYSGLGYDHRFINKQMLALEKKQKQFDVQTPPPLSRKIGDFSWGEGGVCTQASTLATLANSPLYSYKWKRGWSWPCFDTTLLALLCKSCSSYANYYFLSIMIKKRTRFVSKQGQPHPHICTTLSPGLFTHFLREKPWGRGWYLYKGLDKRPTTVK